MKTLQEWLKDIDAEDIISTFLVRYPIDFMLKTRRNQTIEQTINSEKNKLRQLIRTMLLMDAIRSEDCIFYAAPVFEHNRPIVKAAMSQRDEILAGDLPEDEGLEFIPWEQALGYQIADTKLTLDHMREILADILYGLSFFGFDQATCKENTDEAKEYLFIAEADVQSGRVHSAQEVLATLGLRKDEPDQTADELRSKIIGAEWEFNKYCRTREARYVRQILLREE